MVLFIARMRAGYSCAVALLLFIDTHFTFLAIKFKGENCAVLQAKIAWFVCHRINFPTVSQLIEYAIFACH